MRGGGKCLDDHADDSNVRQSIVSRRNGPRCDVKPPAIEAGPGTRRILPSLHLRLAAHPHVSECGASSADTAAQQEPRAEDDLSVSGSDVGYDHERITSPDESFSARYTEPIT
jgi:hypothetical protein